MTRHPITLFRDLHHTRGGLLRWVTFGELAALLGDAARYPADGMTAGTKRAKPTDLGLVGLFESANGDARSDAVVGASLAGFDFDAGTSSLDSVCDALAGRVPFVAHSSWNDSPTVPRFRVVLALSRAALPCEWRGLYRAIADRFEARGHAVDRSCSDAARRFFLPAHRADQAFRTCFDLSGRPIDVDALLGAVRRRSEVPSVRLPVASRPLASTDTRRRRGAGWLHKSAVPTVRTAPHGTRNHVLCRYAHAAGGYAAAGYLDASEAATALLGAILANGGDERKDRDVIARSIAAGYAQPIEMPDRPRAHAVERRAP